MSKVLQRQHWWDWRARLSQLGQIARSGHTLMEFLAQQPEFIFIPILPCQGLRTYASH